MSERLRSEAPPRFTTLRRMIALPRVVALARIAALGLPAALAALAALVTLAPGVGSADDEEAARTGDATSYCVSCHRELQEDEGTGPTTLLERDVHAAAGLGCVGCHGGDPTRDEADSAMSVAAGFKPAPGRLEVPEFCARCHSDAAFMRGFNPQIRVDQLAEYRTSVHGTRNAMGDSIPATCIDCHGAHGILPASSPESPVFAANVPRTCSRCHSDPELMEPYDIATDPYEEWRGSVHAAALIDRGDVAAPACNDCHGNHGAAPPGVESVANVCGQCHGREAALFRASFKKELFDDSELGECTVCHDHHLVRHPSPDLFHSESEPEVSRGSVEQGAPFLAEIGALDSGEEATASWRIVINPGAGDTPGDESRLIHRIEVTANDMKPLLVDASVRAGVGGEISTVTRQAQAAPLAVSLDIDAPMGAPIEYGDPLLMRLSVRASEPVEDVVIRDLPGPGLTPVAGSVCLTCHEVGDECDQATERMYAGLVSLDEGLREARSLLRRAEVAGMEVSEAQFALKSAGTTAAVESRALIHSFDPDRLIERTEEGKTIAAAARDAARAALGELQNRRKGLAVSLVLVALVLLGLYLKIREVDRARRERSET